MMPRFDVESLKGQQGCVVAILGPRTCLATSIIARAIMPDVIGPGCATVISNSNLQEYGHTFPFVPPEYVHDQYDPSILAALVTRLRKNSKEESTPAPSYLVLDDCFWDESFLRDRSVRWILREGRDHGLTTIISMQFPLHLPKGLVDVVFLHRQNLVNTRKRLFEQYVGDAFPSFDAFSETMDWLQNNQRYDPYTTTCIAVDMRMVRGAPPSRVSVADFLWRTVLVKCPEEGGGGAVNEQGDESLFDISTIRRR
jgi:hypothetical protein